MNESVLKAMKREGEEVNRSGAKGGQGSKTRGENGNEKMALN